MGKFKKGENAIPETQFKKGSVPWNKGISGYKNKSVNYNKNSGFQKGHENYHEKGNVWSDESKIKKSANLQGINVEDWNGYKSELNHRLINSSKWKIWREAVFLRDNFTCQNKDCEFCKNKIGVLLQAHHIKQRKNNPELIFNVNNGITYCAEFHLKSGLHKKALKLNSMEVK